MLKQETRPKLQELLLNPFINSVSIDDRKSPFGGIFSIVRIHTNNGTSLGDVKNSVKSVFPGIINNPVELERGEDIFYANHILDNEYEVIIFTDKKEIAPADTGAEKLALSYSSTSDEWKPEEIARQEA